MKTRVVFADLRLDAPAEDLESAHARWGDRLPERLEGDFAFALRDEASGRVFAARDPLGSKPLAYRVVGREIHFASSAGALRNAGGAAAAIDETRIADVLVPALEGADATRTFYRGVERLPPGHRLTFENGRIETAPYWTPCSRTAIRFRSDREAGEAFRSVFSCAVRNRLTEATGSMLSGGLDSSAIVGFARRLRVERGGWLPTFSAIRDDPGCEESRHVRSMLALSGLDPVLFRPGDVEEFRPEIDRFLATMEEPFDATMVIPLLACAAARRKGLHVVLDGVDGDIVASREPDYLVGLVRGLRWGDAIHEARGLAQFYAGTYPPWASAGRLLLANAARAFAPDPVRTAWRRLGRSARVEEALSGTLIRRDFATSAGVGDRLEAAWERRVSPLLHPNLPAAVERYHRVAASQGIEARHPFLDRRLVEFCAALPWDLLVRDGWSKFLVRAATADVLPDDVRWRCGRWVRLGPDFLSALIESRSAAIFDVLDGGRSELEPYVDAAVLDRARDHYRSTGDPATGELLWQSANLASWLMRERQERYDRVPASPDHARRGSGGEPR